MSVVIAGCGDLGTEIGLRLAAQGHEVLGLRRRAELVPAPLTGLPVDLSTQVPELPGDLELLVVATAADGRTPEDYRAAYVDGLRNLLTGVLGAGSLPRRALLISSTAVCGDAGGGEVTEDTPVDPSTPTAEVLLEAEELFHEQFPAGAVLRLSGIYGPGRTRLIEKVRSGGAASGAAWTSARTTSPPGSTRSWSSWRGSSAPRRPRTSLRPMRRGAARSGCPTAGCGSLASRCATRPTARATGPCWPGRACATRDREAGSGYGTGRTGAVAEGHHLGAHALRAGALRAQLPGVLPEGPLVGVRLADVEVQQRPRGHLVALRPVLQDQLLRGPAVEVAHHRLQAEDLVQDRVPGRLVGVEVLLPQRVVVEQVPDRHRDELARGDHARGGVGEALDEDLPVGVALRDQVRDDVLPRLPPPCRDRRAHVPEVEQAHGPRGPDRVQQPAHAAPQPTRVLLPGGRDGEETLQAPGHAVDVRVRQAHHLGGDLHRVAQRDRGQLRPAVAPDPLHQLVGALLHEVPVAPAHRGRGEEPRGGGALTPVLGPVRVEHGRVVAGEALPGRLRAEPGLHRGVGLAQHLADQGQGADVPHAVDLLHPRGGGLTGRDGPAPVAVRDGAAILRGGVAHGVMVGAA